MLMDTWRVNRSYQHLTHLPIDFVEAGFDVWAYARDIYFKYHATQIQPPLGGCICVTIIIEFVFAGGQFI